MLFIRNFIITLPWTIYYGFKNKANTKINIKSPIIYGNQDYSYTKPIAVFIHGRGDCIQHLLPIAEYLGKDMKIIKQAIFVSIPNNIHSSPFDDAKEIRKITDHISKKDKFWIIGLSKGGLDAYIYLSLNTPDNCKGIITIASPLRGTQIAKYHWKWEVSYFLGEDLFKNNHKHLSVVDISKYKVFNITTAYDHLIIGNNVGIAHKFTDHFHCKSLVGHIGIVYDKSVQQKIYQWMIESD